MIPQKFRLGHLVAETPKKKPTAHALLMLANINKAWGADTTIERTVLSLFAKFRKGDTEIDHKPRAFRPVWCDKNHLQQKVETPSTSTLRQIGAVRSSVAPQTIFQHLKATGMVKKLEPCVPHALTQEQRLRCMKTCKSPQ
ncbi:hypothetical protein TNCV_648481 [Trichonephila clavipes]|uniref:Uncharacterized protein n=1 Tax=Trichonephila clavipes TaxID=2585209 RepID=A0A8X6SNY4_TRICX|nr:hypothetical protein TNCV_648481 [Trichonephila clavipes]